MAKCDKCDAHEYLEGSLGDMKKVDHRIAETLMTVQISIAALTENLQETKRTNLRLEELLREARGEIKECKEGGVKLSQAFNIFKARVYAYGSCALIAGSALGWVGDSILKYIA